MIFLVDDVESEYDEESEYQEDYQHNSKYYHSEAVGDRLHRGVSMGQMADSEIDPDEEKDTVN